MANFFSTNIHDLKHFVSLQYFKWNSISIKMGPLNRIHLLHLQILEYSCLFEPNKVGYFFQKGNEDTFITSKSYFQH